MYDDENIEWLGANVVNAEENSKILGDKKRVENDHTIFKVDFEKMVAEQFSNERVVVRSI